MGYDKVAADIEIVDKEIVDSKIKVATDAEIVKQIALVRQFLADKAQLSEEALHDKWKDDFFEFYKAQLSVGTLSKAISELVTNQKEPLGKYLKVILGGGISQGGNPEQARDWFYELNLGSVLSKAGFTVHFEEPDLVIEGNGLSQKIGIACKYPSSDKGIHTHLSKGLSQLKTHGLPGFIALGIDQVVVEQAGLKKFVDFNQGGKNPIDVLQRHADSEVTTLVRERPTKFPSEDPVDEIVVTLSLVGHYGKPAQLVNPTVFAIHCSDTSPIFNDIGIIAEGIGKLAAN